MQSVKMTLFGDALGLGYKEEVMIKNLAAEKSDNAISGGQSPVTVPDGDTGPVVVDPQELETTWSSDSQTFSSINFKVHTIMSAGYHLECPDKKVLDWYNDFLSKIGRIGQKQTFRKIMRMTFKNQFVYGQQFIEDVFNKTQKNIVDLISTDPKKMDYARNEKGDVVFDDMGRPVGYTQTVPRDNGFGDVKKGGDKAPNNVNLKEDQIFVLPKRIAHFKLYELSDNLGAVGMIQPGYQSTIRQKNIEEANANSVFQRGQYPIIDYVGSPERFPTPKMIKSATTKLAQMQHNRYFALPYWHRVEALEVKQSNIVDQTIKILREDKAASLGMPQAFSMGAGEATNRSTLNTQEKFMEFSLIDVVETTIETFRDQVFRRISELEDFKDNKGNLIIPNIVWGEIGAENLDTKAKRLTEYVKTGVLNAKDVRKYAIESEKLDAPIISEVIDTEPKPDNSKKKNLSRKQLSGIKKSNYSYRDVEKILEVL